ncbi:hypothetical protein NZD89_07955 [Alicyclobacillus fastidiosus]|uniref:Uncharacterized protein n=1 Tax=Alicyclobacillus fastidiosus TaxID=392011 RepID=A0ABY6ZK72_9BACL|nr:hypothetical protein [Alicyclobacillus fastidiosus]WAH43313.1 hypothetical protein NZD89_07955 [Alicyclobacillus fastidiosus]GMA65367.1 hypothetical protein GCM10025859_58070 [Alicyclobacillus fastidiosus]
MEERPTNDNFDMEPSFGAPSDAEELDGNEITQEQIRDVYFAGTSDGVVYLGGTKILNLEDGEQSE